MGGGILGGRRHEKRTKAQKEEVKGRSTSSVGKIKGGELPHPEKEKSLTQR